MKEINSRRRGLLKTAMAGAIAQCLPSLALAQSNNRIRLEWQQFRQTSQYNSFRAGIAAMRANTNPSDRSSLNYWANVHANYCPHGSPYFVAWHRGYLYYFEQQLRIVSGNPDLNLPYWDYFTYSTMPAEFTDPTPGNPLYRQRLSTDIYNALDLSPFAANVYNFELGTENAFEPKLEHIHNNVHNLLGGVMATMQSPMDPIFYLHHANIDRLTHAWALPDGKGIPFSDYPYSPTNSDPYWAENHVYATDLSLERWWTLIPRWLGNDYSATNVPTSLPAPATAMRSSANAGAGLLSIAPRILSLTRPVFRSFTPSPRRRLPTGGRSVGGALQLALDERSFSLLVKLDREDASDIPKVLARRRSGRQSADQDAQAIKIVIDRAVLSGAGPDGGYYYALYLNMPARIDSLKTRSPFLVGSLGPFQVASASHHGPAKIEFDVTDLLSEQKLPDFLGMSVSLVRVDGDHAPAGTTILIDEIRLDVVPDARPVPRKPLTKPSGWYLRSAPKGRPPKL